MNRETAIALEPDVDAPHSAPDVDPAPAAEAAKRHNRFVRSLMLPGQIISVLVLVMPRLVAGRFADRVPVQRVRQQRHLDRLRHRRDSGADHHPPGERRPARLVADAGVALGR